MKKQSPRYLKRTHKFGIEVPKTVNEEALELDKKNGNTLWADEISKEMKNVRVAFKILPDGQSAPIGYQKIPCHMIFDVKMEDFRRKAQLIAGGHRTKAPATITYASVVSRETVCIALLMAALNDLEFKVGAVLSSLTPKSVLAGTKNSRLEGFWLAKHKNTNIPTMMEPFSPPVAWFYGRTYNTPGRLFTRGWTRPPSKSFIRINKKKEKIIYFCSISVNYNNRSPAVGNDSQNGINCHRRAAIIYELTNNILKNNSVAQLYFIMTRIMLFSYGYARQIINNRKNAAALLYISMAMRIRRYGAKRIAQ
jgi:hypothetical protein